MAVRDANQTMDCEQLSGCYGTDKKDNGGGGDDMAKTPGEQKTMLEYNAERDGQHQVVAAPKKQQRPSFRHFMIEAPFLEVSFGGEKHVQMIVYDDGITDDYSINNHSNKHNSRHGTAFTDGFENGCWPVMSSVYDELACFFFWLGPQGSCFFIVKCEIIHSFSASLATSGKIGQKAKVVGVFLMLLSVGQASPFKDLSAAGEPLGKSGTSAKNKDGSSAWWIWALILLAFAGVLLLGIGGAFAYWKWRRQNRAPTAAAPPLKWPPPMRLNCARWARAGGRRIPGPGIRPRAVSKGGKPSFETARDNRSFSSNSTKSARTDVKTQNFLYVLRVFILRVPAFLTSRPPLSVIPSSSPPLTTKILPPNHLSPLPAYYK